MSAYWSNHYDRYLKSAMAGTRIPRRHSSRYRYGNHHSHHPTLSRALVMRTALQELIYHELLKAREAVDLAARLKSSGNDSSIRDTYTSLWLASIQKVAEASGLPPRVIRGKQDENEES